jgi:2-keto-4-pentenoate hydratase/2-oxohepta-3-ene-1,7-dioic acid hydratase in catechol pathway
MRLRRLRKASGEQSLAVWDETSERWIPIAPARTAVGDSRFSELGEDPVALLAGGARVRSLLEELCSAARPQLDEIDGYEPAPLLPFQPSLLRAFALSERHWIQSARGHVRRNLRWALPGIRAVETVTRRPFRAFRPSPLFYREPQYYIGNALTLIPDGAEVPWPAFTRALDFELELAAIVVAPVRDASPEQAADAIGGFVVFNDLTARDTQWTEVRGSLFGPITKSKSFASALGAEIVSADVVLPRAGSLRAEVRVNGEVWSRTDTADLRWSFPQMLAHASKGENVHPGELLSSGTLPDGCGLELNRWLKPGDDLELTIEHVGSVRNRIGRPS